MSSWADDYRQYFPVTRNWAYFNHAATAPYSTRTAQALQRYVSDFTENGGTNYAQWEKIREETRGLAGQLLNCTAEEIALTANTSEGANIVAQGLGFEANDNVVIPEEDFPANVYPWLNLRQKGVEVRLVPLDRGRLTLEDLLGRVDDRTRLVAVSSVAYHNGYRLDLEALGAALEVREVPLYVDAIQSMGVLPLDVAKCKISFLSADGHKWLLAPEGAAVFYCAADRLNSLNQAYLSWLSVREPFDFGQTTIELAPSARRFECGTPNFAGTVGLHSSLKMILEVGVDRIEKRVLSLLEQAVDRLEQKGYEVRSPRKKGEQSGILTFSHERYDPETLKDRLLEAKVVTTLRGGGVRISPHFYNNEEEIEQMLAALP